MSGRATGATLGRLAAGTGTTTDDATIGDAMTGGALMEEEAIGDAATGEALMEEAAIGDA